MWSAVTFGGAFGIADDEAQMAEVVVIAPCWNAGRRLLKFLERFGNTLALGRLSWVIHTCD